MKQFLKQWQCMLLTLLLSLLVGQTARADSYEHFTKERFVITSNDSCLHFKFLVRYLQETDRTYVDESSPVTIEFTGKNGEYKKVAIFAFDGWREKDDLNFSLYYGTVAFTNVKLGGKYCVLEEPCSVTAMVDPQDDGHHFFECDWYPPREWVENVDKCTMYVNINAYNWYQFYSNKHRKFDFTYNNVTLPKNNPTFTIDKNISLISDPEAPNGFSWEVKYTTSKKPEWASKVRVGAGGNDEKEYKTVPTTFREMVSEQAYSMSYKVRQLRTSKMQKTENRYWENTAIADFPAYHQIHNFGVVSSSSTPLLTWEMTDIKQRDFQTTDAFIVQCSKSNDFKDVVNLEMPYTLGTSSTGGPHGFKSELRDGSKGQKFYCDIPSEDYKFFRIQRKSTVRFGWNHSFVAYGAVTKFISDISVSVATNSTQARNMLLNAGYKLMDYDLNYGVNGHYVYIGYKESDSPIEAITRIAIRKGGKYKPSQNQGYVDGKYEMLPVSVMGIDDGNLNAGVAGSDSLYLYYSRSNSRGKGNVLLSRILHSKSSSELPTGYRYVGEGVGTDPSPININSGCPQGTTVINLVCQMHTHVNDYYAAVKDYGLYCGHDCCGVMINMSVDDGTLGIKNVDELYAFADAVNIGNNGGINAKLLADIEVNKGVLVNGNLNKDPKAVKTFRKWTPVGTESTPYNGKFHGNGHTISGLYATENNANVGLFGNIRGANILDVNVKDSYLAYTNASNSNYAVGGIVGRVVSGSITTEISSCTFDGVVMTPASSTSAGGILGANTAGVCDIKNSMAKGRIDNKKWDAYAGYICGGNGGTLNVTSCLGMMATNPDTIMQWVGGIVGNMVGCSQGTGTGRTTITNSYYSAKVDKRTSQYSSYKKGEAVTPAQLRGGYAAYGLNKNQEEKHWAQLLGTDSYPVFFDTVSHTIEKATVYQVPGRDCMDSGKSVDSHLFSNRSGEPAVLIHNAKHYPAVQATCAEQGNLEYWQCQTEGCKKLFADESCMLQIQQIPIIELTGQHDFDDYDICRVCRRSRQATAVHEMPTDDHQPVTLYTVNGIRVTEAHRGLIIVKSADGKTYKMLKK